MSRMPDFLIIGAAKAGTTTLYESLTLHPAIYMPELKEPCFFSDEDKWSLGIEWYRSLFAGASSEQFCGEASTNYTRWPHSADAAARIAENCGDVKLIYMLRHPVDRAYSHYGHRMRKKVSMTFEEAIRTRGDYLDCSRYMTQIERYLRFFGRDRFHFVFLEDLRERPADVVSSCVRFLGLEDVALPRFPVANTRSGFLAHRRATELFSRVKSAPCGRLLACCAPGPLRSLAYRAVVRINRLLPRQDPLPPMRPETRAQLLETFAPEVRRLEQFLERSLPGWAH